MILLGPAGNVEGDILTSLKKIKVLNLDAQEIEFVHSVMMGNELAKKAGALAKELNIRLSVHAPYYINLLSEDKNILDASKERILKSCERAHYLGAKYVIFHTGFYGKLTEEVAYSRVKIQISELMNEIKKNNWNVHLCPETMGKKSQFGSLDELIKLVKETGCKLCVDFAHLLARDQKIDYKEVFEKLKVLKLKELTCHFSGIEFTAKGERRHLLLDKKHTKELLSEAKKQSYDMIIICEAPNTWEGSLEMKKEI
ncbi:TIM barrel protein [Candidatus Woesearchaeota archaeon]|nr:TIM barrel protein [Candidatus Woesearchaeota archaeon]